MDDNLTVAEKQKVLDDFFHHIDELRKWYEFYTSEVPKYLFVNPEIIARMSRVEGFYQRPELGGIVSAYAPVIRYFKFTDCVVTIVEDWEEKFLHFDS